MFSSSKLPIDEGPKPPSHWRGRSIVWRSAAVWATLLLFLVGHVMAAGTFLVMSGLLGIVTSLLMFRHHQARGQAMHVKRWRRIGCGCVVLSLVCSLLLPLPF